MAIGFVEGSSAGPFCLSEYEALVDLIRIDNPSFDLDPSYVSFVKQHNGGIPIENSFTTPSGKWLIDVFLNFADTKQADPVNADRNVLAFLEEVEERTSVYFIPFAIVVGGNLLCFDYTVNESLPAIVLWYLEDSKKERVASTFAEFLTLLST